MRRSVMLACRVRPKDLIIANGNVRLRVTWVDSVQNGDGVIIHGDTPKGPVGIAHNADDTIVRLD